MKIIVSNFKKFLKQARPVKDSVASEVEDRIDEETRRHDQAHKKLQQALEKLAPVRDAADLLKGKTDGLESSQ